MEKEDIINGSKLLARYLGYEYFPFNSEEKDLMWGWFNSKLPKEVRHKNSKILGSSNVFLGRTHKDLKFFWDWRLLHRVYESILKEQLYESNDEDLDILMIIVGDNLLDSDREGFFLSLVEVVIYINSKNGK